MKRTQTGISLIELIFTLAIAGILASISIPALGSLTRGAQSRTAGESLVASLNLARMSAVNRQRDVVVCPSANQADCDDDIHWQSGWIVFVDANGDGQHDAGESVLETVQARSGIAIAATQGRKHITYHADGTAPGTNLTLTLCDAHTTNASTIVVNNAGRVRGGTATAEQTVIACGT